MILSQIMEGLEFKAKECQLSLIDHGEPLNVSLESFRFSHPQSTWVSLMTALNFSIHFQHSDYCNGEQLASRPLSKPHAYPTGFRTAHGPLQEPCSPHFVMTTSSSSSPCASPSLSPSSPSFFFSPVAVYFNHTELFNM